MRSLKSFALLCAVLLWRESGFVCFAHAQPPPTPPASPMPAPAKPHPDVQALLDKAHALTEQNKWTDALPVYEEALTKARSLHDQVGEASALHRVGNVYRTTGQPQKALEFYQQALILRRQVGNKSGEADTLNNISAVYSDIEQPQKALEFFQQALLLYRQVGDKSGEASALNNIGAIHANSKQAQKALEFFQQALPLRRQLGDKSREAETLGDIGRVYSDIGQSQEALKFFQQALPLYRQVGDKSGEAETLTNIGVVYFDIGQPQKALEFYRQALILRRQVGDKSGEAGTLGNIGNVYRTTGQPQKALEFLQQALTLCRATGNKQFEVTTLGNIGNVYRTTGQPQKALEFYQQALPLCRQVGDKSGEAGALNNIGKVYLAIGQPQKALELLQQALLMCRQLGDKNDEARALCNIGVVYFNIGQPQKALEFYQQALPLCRAAGNKRFEAIMLDNIGGGCAETGLPQKALEFFQQALPLYRQFGDKNGEASALNNIGSIYANSKQMQKALKFFQQALPLYRQVGDKSGEAETLSNIGRIYSDIGQPQEALGFLQLALSLCRAARNKRFEAITLDVLAYCEQSLSHDEQALRYGQQAVAVLEQLRANVVSQGEARSAFLTSNLNIYYRCLGILHLQGHIAEAFALAQKTKARSLLDLLASSQVDLTAALTPNEKQQLQTLQEQAENLNRQMLKEGVENEVGAKKRFAALQTQLKQNESQLQLLMDRLYALHPQMADQQQARTATLNDAAHLLPADAALLEYVQISDKALLLFVVTTRAGKPQVRLYPIVVPNALLQKQCTAFHNACADPRRDPSALSVSLSRLLLSPASKSLTGKKRLIVCPDGPLWDVPFAALRAPAATRRTHPYLWQQYELSYAYSATGMQAALAAYTRHKPAEQATALVLANPDFGTSQRFGDLDTLPGQRPFEMPSRPFEMPSRPFEMPSRPFEMPSRPFEVPSRPFEMPSRPFEMPSRPVLPPSRQLTAMLERGSMIKSLPGAQQEAAAIRKLFPDAAIYTGKAAQEHVVMEEAGKYKYLHFATHGFFNDAAPLLSCIILAQPDKKQNQANKAATIQGAGENKAATVANAPVIDADVPLAMETEDGLLTARKVFGLHLNADLVTLSACNSGRGQVRTGEGIVGLTWAFFAAGCPSQVVSQWSVDDAATGQLMATFYAGLKAGQSKSAALRNAALQLSQDGRHSHPYYWTPFFLVGDWR